MALKEVPASNEVLASPFGIPHGGGVRTLSKKSRLRDLARGKSSLTWQFTQSKSCNKATTPIGILLPDASAMFKPVEKKQEKFSLNFFTLLLFFLSTFINLSKFQNVRRSNHQAVTFLINLTMTRITLFSLKSNMNWYKNNNFQNFGNLLKPISKKRNKTKLGFSWNAWMRNKQLRPIQQNRRKKSFPVCHYLTLTDIRQKMNA